jgi:membrane protein YqaA with SNARE-associated domain
MYNTTGLLDLVLRSGGLGLVVIGTLDSSFLFAPWGNDLLVIAMTARNPHPGSMLYYALMSTIGSVLGCLLIDVTLRPLGAKGLEKHLSKRTLKRVESKVRDKAGQSLVITSLVPPPFPFTAFIMAASAMQYPRRKLLLIIAASRMVRFTALGILALRFGESILKWSKNPWVQRSLIALVVVCTVGSIVSVYGWIRRTRS